MATKKNDVHLERPKLNQSLLSNLSRRNRLESMAPKVRNQVKTAPAALGSEYPPSEEVKYDLTPLLESLKSLKFGSMSKQREINEWASKPVEIDFLKKRKIATTNSTNKSQTTTTDEDDDDDEKKDLDNDSIASYRPKKEINLNDYEDANEEHNFNRRHAKYGAYGRNRSEMNKFIYAKMLEANLKQLSKERFIRLRKIDSDKFCFIQNRLMKAHVKLDSNYEKCKTSNEFNAHKRKSTAFENKSGSILRNSAYETDNKKHHEKNRVRIDTSMNNDFANDSDKNNQPQTSLPAINKPDSAKILNSRPSIFNIDYGELNKKHRFALSDERFVNLSKDLKVTYVVKEMRDLDKIIEKNMALKYTNIITENNEKKMRMKKKGAKFAAIAREVLASGDYVM